MTTVIKGENPARWQLKREANMKSSGSVERMEQNSMMLLEQ